MSERRVAFPGLRLRISLRLRYCTVALLMEQPPAGIPIRPEFYGLRARARSRGTRSRWLYHQ